MAVQQVGPLFYVDGPPPRAPRYTLVGAADINPETDEHWANGIQVHGYVPDVACRWSRECDFDDRPAKNPQQNPNPLPEFGPLTIYLAETCSTKSIMIGSQDISGMAPCAPLPVILMSKKSEPAIAGPVRIEIVPNGAPGKL